MCWGDEGDEGWGSCVGVGEVTEAPGEVSKHSLKNGGCWEREVEKTDNWNEGPCAGVECRNHLEGWSEGKSLARPRK